MCKISKFNSLSTVDELLKVYKVMEKYGLKRGERGLEIYLMAELPKYTYG